MKNIQLKQKLLNRNEQMSKSARELEVLNLEQLNNTHGGKGGSCPLLVFCGVYGMHNCTIKLRP